MKKSRLTKKLLSKLIIGDYNQHDNHEILDTDEVSSMIYNQWNSPYNHDQIDKNGLQNIFVRIQSAIKPDESANSKYYLGKIEELKRRNDSLKVQFRIWFSVAAGLLLVFSIASATFALKNKIFEKTITESIAPLGQKSQIILADETKVFLNSGTILRYDSHFGKRNRRIELVGEAYFEVTKNEKLPFTIFTSDVEIEVVGTKFNVMAYPDEPSIETIVTEGRVNVTDLTTRKSLTLTANQSASFFKKNRDLFLNNIDNISTISWKENVMYFDNENFENVIRKLERWYNVSIKLVGKDSIDDRFTLTIKDESLKEVLDLIKHTTPMSYKFEGKQVTIIYKNTK